MIVVEGLKVSYRWRQEPVLKGVDGRFDGKSLILGPNGSGKTTLFRAVCGLTRVVEGRVLVDGRNVEEIYAEPGVLSVNFPEAYSLLSVKVRDLITLYSDLAGSDPSKAYEILEDLGITRELLERRKLHELSAGQRKAVCTAMALSMGARHVLLDEPFEQLDPARKGRLIGHLARYDGIILLNTHETWLMKNLPDWDAYFMFEGRMYGPAKVEELLNVRLRMGKRARAVLCMEVSGRTVSLVKGRRGTLLTSLESLDRVYELALEAGA